MFDRLLAHQPDERAVVAPDRQGALEFVTPAAKPEPALSRVPKEPERLASFLHRHGGVNDIGGELKTALGGAKFRPGLINANGLDWDEAARLAGEAGYFPELGNARPTVNDIKDRLAEDIRGRPQYAAADLDKVLHREDVLARNAEVDRLATQHGIDPKGLTRAEFYDRVAAAAGEAKAVEHTEELAADAADAFKDGEEFTAAWNEDQGEPTDPALLYGEARTDEDLERKMDRPTILRIRANANLALRNPLVPDGAKDCLKVALDKADAALGLDDAVKRMQEARANPSDTPTTD